MVEALRTDRCFRMTDSLLEAEWEHRDSGKINHTLRNIITCFGNFSLYINVNNEHINECVDARCKKIRGCLENSGQGCDMVDICLPKYNPPGSWQSLRLSYIEFALTKLSDTWHTTHPSFLPLLKIWNFWFVSTIFFVFVGVRCREMFSITFLVRLRLRTLLTQRRCTARTTELTLSEQ
jgi:hypothetical protein